MRGLQLVEETVGCSKSSWGISLALLFLLLSQRVQICNNLVLGFWVMVSILQVLVKYMIL